MRRLSQTPREYAAAVAAGNPVIQAELREMTLAFEDARYSNRLPEPSMVRRIQMVWSIVRSGLPSREA
jgi:hypothetical protein